MVKTEDDIDGENCQIFVKEEHIFAFAPDGNRIPVTDQIKAGLRSLEKGA